MHNRNCTKQSNSPVCCSCSQAKKRKANVAKKVRTAHPTKQPKTTYHHNMLPTTTNNDGNKTTNTETTDYIKKEQETKKGLNKDYIDSIKDCAPIDEFDEFIQNQMCKRPVDECTPVLHPDQPETTLNSQQTDRSRITNAFSQIDWNSHHDPVTFQHVAEQMLEGFRKRLTYEQKMLLDETISLNTHLVDTKVLTMAAAINSTHDTLKYFLRCALFKTSSSSISDLTDVDNNFLALVIQNHDVYYNPDVYLQHVRQLFHQCSGTLTENQLTVLRDTIVLNKNLVKNQDIIVSEAISRVCFLLQHFQRHSHTILRAVSCSPLTIPAD